MAVNKMLNSIDFEHLQTALLSVSYARIKIFFSVAGRYYDDKIINVKTPKFLSYVRQLIAKKTLFCGYWLAYRENGCREAQTSCLSQQTLVTTFLEM